MNEFINQITINFNIEYIFTSILLTYILIKIIDYINGDYPVNIIIKRMCLIGSLLSLGLANIYFANTDIIVIINSAIATPVCWSWILRPIFMKLGIGYKQIEDAIS